MKKSLIVLTLLFCSTIAFGQNESLMKQLHKKDTDYAMQLIFKLAVDNGVCTQEDFEEFKQDYLSREAEYLAQFDELRHKALLEAFQQAQNAKIANIVGAVTGAAGLAQVISNDQKRVDAENEAKAKAAAAASLEKSRQRNAKLDAERQAGYEATKQAYSNSSSASGQAYNSTSNNGSVKDLYTSDPTWNRTVDQLNQQYGPEKTRQMVKEMRAQQAQSTQTTQTTTSTNRDGSIPGSTVLTAVTANRTLVYIQINSGSITHYATGGKNQMGEYNWNYAGKVSIQNINMTSYASQFGKDYSHAANINGVGYVFFNY